MNTTPTTFSAASPAALSRRTVDAPTRVFHWLLALSFLGAYITADGERWRLVHITLGYTMAGLLVFRVLWGLFGPRHARLSNLWRKLQGLPGWVRGLSAGTPNGRLGQNLAMTLGVVTLLALIAPLTLSGYGSYQEWSGEWLEEVHEVLGNTMLTVVLAHVALVIVLSLLRRKNQITPMLTGRTEGAGPDLVRRNHTLVGALVVAAVLAFWTWQWQAAPNGPLSDGAGVSEQYHGDGSGKSRHHRDHDDD